MTNIFSKQFTNKKRKKFSFFYTFLICGILFFGINKNIIYLCFLPLLLFFIMKKDLKVNVGMFIIISFFLLFLFLFGQYCIFNKFSIWLEQLFNFSFRNKIFLFIEKNYEKNVGGFINLIIFNRKDS